MTDWDKILSQAEVPIAMRERKKTYTEKTTWRVALEKEKTEGWYFFKDTKNPDKVKVRRDKSESVNFENRLWVLFAQMGFERLNRDAHFEIEYSIKTQNHKKQIDVFAADEETVLVVECKCAEKPKEKAWKTELEAIKGYMQGVRNEISKEFPNHNIKFIFATQNYIVGKSDKDLMDEFGIAYFDEKVIKYYEELAKHLGRCSRYQLLGALFANNKIKGMDNRIPAIQGKMGGYTYYAFSIQPEIKEKSTHNRRERPVCGHRGRSRGPFYYRITTFGKGPWDARDPHKTTFMALKHVIRLSIWQRQKETPGVEKAPGVSSPQRKESGRSGRDDGELRFGYDPAIHARRLRVYHRPRRLRMASRISIFFAARRFEPLNSMG